MKRLAIVIGVACLALLGVATPAFAHNSLVSSSPANEASVESTPATIKLTFDQPVQNGEGLNSVTVKGPDDTAWRTGPVDVESNVVTTTLDELGPAGGYTITYRVVSADGHPVSGDVKFTLTTAGNGTPTTATEETDTGGGLPIWVWIVGAVVLLGAGVTVAMRTGSKQPR